MNRRLRLLFLRLRRSLMSLVFQEPTPTPKPPAANLGWDKAEIIKRCTVGKEHALRVLPDTEVDSVSSVFENLIFYLSEVLDWIEALDSTIQANSHAGGNPVDTGLRRVKALNPRAHIMPALGGYIEKLRADYAAVEKMRNQAWAVVESIVYICETAWVTTARVGMDSNTRRLDGLREALGQIRTLGIHPEGTALNLIESGELQRRLGRLLTVTPPRGMGIPPAPEVPALPATPPVERTRV